MDFGNGFMVQEQTVFGLVSCAQSAQGRTVNQIMRHMRSFTLIQEGLQTGLDFLYSGQCHACGEAVMGQGRLCGACYAQLHLLRGARCGLCAQPMAGLSPDGQIISCDDCLHAPPPWDRGFAACQYRGTARSLILALKHADRTDLAHPLGMMMARALGDVPQGAVIAPVPLHWMRALSRRYNQAGLLADVIAAQTGLPVMHTLLRRLRRTRMMEHFSRAQRIAAQQGSIQCTRLAPKHVIVVDDVMTTGATCTAATTALRMMGAQDVTILTLARVAKPL